MENLVHSKERQGEIALLILKARLGKEEIPAPNQLKRVLANLAQEVGIPLDELAAFARPIYEEIMRESFDKICKFSCAEKKQ